MIAELEVQNWRETTRERLLDEAILLEAELQTKLPQYLAKAGRYDLLNQTSFLKSTLEPFLNRELAAPFAAQLRQIESEAESLPWIELEDDATNQMFDRVMAGAGAATSIAPLAIVPFIAGITTITTTTFFGATTAVVSIPIAATVLLVAGSMAYFGSSLTEKQFTKMRAKLELRAREMMQRKIFGGQIGASSVSFLPLLMTKADEKAMKRMRAT